MAAHANGASMGDESRSQVLVTGAELPAENTPPKAGEMPAVIVDISAARALGYHPQYDLKSGLATVWPEFSEAAQ
jgi:UDP-glucose 4-epimerase